MTQKVTSKRKQYKNKRPKGNDTKENNGKEMIQLENGTEEIQK